MPFPSRSNISNLSGSAAASPSKERFNQISSFARRLSNGHGQRRPGYFKAFRTASHAARSMQGAKTGMAGMLDIDRNHPRRERTFAGGECVVCEEPLEHTLRGERILQLSCAHVSHEACFYEFIRESDSQSCPSCNAPLGLDSNRGGNVLDIGQTQPKCDFVLRILIRFQKN